MAAVNFEAIYAALAALWPTVIAASPVGPLKMFGRRLHHWSEEGQMDYPALFQTQGNEDSQYVVGAPGGTHHIDVVLVIYTNAGEDPNAAPAIQLNQIVQVIRDTLEPDVMGFQRLGIPNVLYARVRSVTHDEGVLGSIAVATVVIEIRVSG